MRKLISMILALAMALGIACVHAEANVPDLTGDWLINLGGLEMYLFLYEEGEMEMMFTEDVPTADDGEKSIKGYWAFDGTTLKLYGENKDENDVIPLLWDEATSTLSAEIDGVAISMKRAIDPENPPAEETASLDAASREEGSSEPVGSEEANSEAAGPLMGGWMPAADPSVTEETNALIEKALDGLVGVNYVPVAYLGNQVVAGMNHAILCQATTVVPDAVPTWKILYLYEDLQGNVTVLNIADFDFGALCRY